MKTQRIWILGLLALSACATQNTTGSGLSLNNMDRSVRAQDDLYRFANGGWLQRTEIPADKSNYGTFTVLADNARRDVRKIIEEAAALSSDGDSEAQKLGRLYRSMMDTERLESLGNSPIQAALQGIGAVTTKEELARWLGGARKHGIRTPIGVYISYDQKNPQRYLAHLTQSGLGLPDRDYYFRQGERAEKLRAAYRGHIANTFQHAGICSNQELADRWAQSAYAIELALAEGHWTRVQRRDRDKSYNLTQVEELTARHRAFPWPAYLAGSELTNQAELVVREPSYLDVFETVYAEQPLESWKRYATWHLLKMAAPYMHQGLDAERFNFYQRVLVGVPEAKPRWERAVHLVNRILGEAVGKLYVARHFQPEAKRRMKAMVEQLRSAYATALKELSWLGASTRAKALDKLAKFRPKIGYPDRWKDYGGLTVRADDLLGNVKRASAWRWRTRLAKLGGPVDRDEWFMTPQTVNAYYNPPMNEIVFPAAILQPPFFNLAADDAVNYGAIGAVIGHEMGHGFDDQGAKSDGDGVLRNWWTDTDLKEFRERTAKLVDQAAAHTVLDGQALNGELTLGENIGDLGGLTIALRAWRQSLNGRKSPVLDGFTGLQRFFLGWAQVWARKYRNEELKRRLVVDPHAPSEFRTNSPIRNMPAFIKAFGVGQGDKLYLPESERVKIW